MTPSSQMASPSIPGPAEIELLTAPLLLRPLPPRAWAQLSLYLHLLYRWNQRMSLTAVRDPRLLVALHLGECLRAAQSIPDDVGSVLDFGSGAGLPGIPIQLARPELSVTLAESQTKKASFLREAVRELELPNTTVSSGRVEDLPGGDFFDLVALRAVDRMDQALLNAYARIRPGGHCLVLTSESDAAAITAALPALQWQSDPVPATRQRVILLGSHTA